MAFPALMSLQGAPHYTSIDDDDDDDGGGLDGDGCCRTTEVRVPLRSRRRSWGKPLEKETKGEKRERKTS